MLKKCREKRTLYLYDKIKADIAKKNAISQVEIALFFVAIINRLTLT